MNTDMSAWTKQYPNAPLRDPAAGWFVNRKDQLNIIWNWACKIPTKGSRSITGLRRTGKSTIMAKIYNRLYFEQERVMPIYIRVYTDLFFTSGGTYLSSRGRD